MNKSRFMEFFVTATDTDAGKSVVSSILVKSLLADYWKPIQSGDLHFSDTDRVRKWVNDGRCFFHPESYRLETPCSPHHAAFLDNISIELDHIQKPKKKSDHLIVEGAGGLMVPINDSELIIDMIEYLSIPVILVSKFYLGSINHTLLSIQALQKRDIPIYGIVYNGQMNPSSVDIITKMSGIHNHYHLPNVQSLNNEFIVKHAREISKFLNIS